MKPKRYLTDEDIVKLMVAASKWGSHAYKDLYKKHHGVVYLRDFQIHREEVMEDILKEYKAD